MIFFQKDQFTSNNINYIIVQLTDVKVVYKKTILLKKDH